MKLFNSPSALMLAGLLAVTLAAGCSAGQGWNNPYGYNSGYGNSYPYNSGYQTPYPYSGGYQSGYAYPGNYRNPAITTSSISKICKPSIRSTVKTSKPSISSTGRTSKSIISSIIRTRQYIRMRQYTFSHIRTTRNTSNTNPRLAEYFCSCPVRHDGSVVTVSKAAYRTRLPGAKGGAISAEGRRQRTVGVL